MRLRGNFRAIVFVLMSHAAAQTMPPPPGTIKTLFRFTINATTGDTPLAGLILGNDGNLYGTTSSGGDKQCRCGTIFRITTDGTLTTIYTFTNGIDSGPPNSPLVKDRQGNFYGTTGSGITPGRAFRITPDGTFTSSALPGSRPNGLVFSNDGNLYGTTEDFGAGGGYGTFYQLTTGGVVTMLHRFDLTTEGITFPSAVVEGPDGSFYGTAQPDTVFKITRTGDLTVLFKSPNGPAGVDGVDTFASSLTLGSDGNFYGAGRGGVYTITPTGSFSRLIRFSDVNLPQDPGGQLYQDRAALLLAADGNFYGTTQTQGQSSVYQVASGGSYQLIYRFAYSLPPFTMLYPEGVTPSRLTQGADGLYGTTSSGGGSGNGGTVFKITLSGGGTPTLPPPPPPATLDSLTAFDPNTPDLQPVIPLFGVEGAKPWDQTSYQALAGSQTMLNGFVADGVTPVVLRVHASAAGASVTFAITDSTCPDNPSTDQPCDNGPEQVGSLCTIDSMNCSSGLPNLPVTAQQITNSNGNAQASMVDWMAVLSTGRNW